MGRLNVLARQVVKLVAFRCMGGWKGATRLSVGKGMVVIATASCLIPPAIPANRVTAAAAGRTAQSTQMAFATYLGYHGGTGADTANGVKVDSSGNLYVVGTTDSGLAHKAIVVDKLDSHGTKLLYSTLLGGGCDAQGGDLALDGSGNAFVTGLYTSKDTYGICDLAQVVVAKISPTGTILYNVQFGGTGGLGARDWGNGIAVDRQGNAFVTGQIESDDSFPTTPGAFMKTGPGYVHTDAFVLKVDRAGKLVYSTILGGADLDHANAIVVDSRGDAYVTGQTASTDFPTTPNAYERRWASPHGLATAFLTVLNPSGSALIYSTYLGGNGTEQGTGVAVDQQGNAYLTGATDSSNFPTTGTAYSRACGKDGHCGLSVADQAGCVVNCTFFDDAFMAEINPNLPAKKGLVYATYLGGTLSDAGAAIAVDGAHHVYVAGSTSSTNFPTMAATQLARGAAGNALNANSDAFVTELDPAKPGPASLLFSTYLGGSADDGASGIALGPGGALYVVGTTASPDFPTVSPLQRKLGGGSDAFLAGFKLNAALH